MANTYDPSQQTGLGQSLANVLARTARRPQERGSGVTEVEVGLIRPADANPRQRFDEAALEELASSIRQHGLLQPIVVQRRDEGYEIIAGERRWRAARKIGLERIPVLLREGDDERHLAELRLVENIQRENLNPIELAQAYIALQEEYGLSQEELAVRLGKDRSSISNTTRLMQLPKEVCDDIAQGRISLGHAKALLALPSPDAQCAVAKRLLEEGWSVRETERQCRLWGRGSGSGSERSTPGGSSHIREVEANLFRLLGAPVSVRERGGKGSITVSFASKAAFQQIVEVFERVCKEASQTSGPSA